jgi:glycerol kinase
VDSWLLWQLTGGRIHATDPSNASRTLCFDIRRLDWDAELTGHLRIPREVFPAVRPSAGVFGETIAHEGLPAGIPVAGIAGDQQAALFGQGALAPGGAKNTYGTGCFLLLNTGPTPVASNAGLLTTVAWTLPPADGDGRPAVSYALEGAIFVAGAAVQWLRDGLGLIKTAAETEALARSVPDTGGVYLVPAFVGLGAPYWDMYARGALVGLTRGTARAHVARATLEAIAYQTRDVLEVMAAEAGGRPRELRVDGGATENDFLCQFQADILGLPILRSRVRAGHDRRAARHPLRRLAARRRPRAGLGARRGLTGRRARSGIPSGPPECYRHVSRDPTQGRYPCALRRRPAGVSRAPRAHPRAGSSAADRG